MRGDFPNVTGMAVCGRRAHNSSPKTIHLDPVREPGQLRVSEQFLPASDDGSGLGYEYDLHRVNKWRHEHGLILGFGEYQ